MGFARRRLGKSSGPGGCGCETAHVIEVPDVVRNRAVAVGAEEWLERLAALVQGLEDDWGVVERLSSGLLCTRIQFQPLGSDTLRAVEAVAGMTIG